MDVDVKGFIAAVLSLYNYILDRGLRELDEITFSLNDVQYSFSRVSFDGDSLKFRFRGIDYIAYFRDGEVDLNISGGVFTERVEERVMDLFIVKANVGGRIVEVFIREGDRVSEGSTLFKIEAMKMEVDVKSPVNGIVEKIYVSRDMNVKLGSPLASIRVER